MKRRILIVLLSIGALGGYAAGFASVACRAHGRHARFEQHVAKICVDAARESGPR